MLTVPEKTSVALAKRMEEERMKEERMKYVMVLLEQLFEREEATIKQVLNCLYDVGSVNLINRKVRFRPLNGVMKAIAKLTKPAFRFFAIRWFKKNCPKLITDWLEAKVSF
jgi:hypothetical protein